MRKYSITALSFLALGFLFGNNNDANASGIYFGASYGLGTNITLDVDTKASQTVTIPFLCNDFSGDGNYDFCTDDAKTENLILGGGVTRMKWDDNDDENWHFETTDAKIMTFSVGFDIPRSPLRYEYEQFNVSADMGAGYMKIDSPAWDVLYGNGSEFMIEMEGTGEKIDINAQMLNVYLEIPFKDLDPYVGIGMGYANIKMDIPEDPNDPQGLYVESEKGIAKQYMFGIEKRLDRSPIIVGIEYRIFSLDDAKDELDDVTSFSSEFSDIMLKFRYDPIM